MRGRTRVEVPGLMAEFGSEGEVQHAVVWLQERGYSGLEIYSPYPVEGATALVRQRRPILNWIVFWAAVVGALLAIAVQWFTNALDYPINVGGRPLLSVPAWIPITFELAVLAGGVAAFVGLLISTGLPRLWHPVFEVPGFERASVDRFWVGIDRSDPRFDPERSRRELEELRPLRVVVVEDRR